MTRHPVACALLVALAACTSPENRAAKERIFSPEDPPKDVELARQPLDVRTAATDPAVWRRLWRMDRREITGRVGAHRADTDLTLRWGRGEKTISLKEKHEFTTDAAGQFRALLTNSEDSGLEFVWVGGKAFARGRYGPFRARRTDRAQQDEWREEATAGLRTFFDLCDRRLRPGDAVATDVRGRPALRFTAMLGEPWGPAEPAPQLPPARYGLVRTDRGSAAEAGKQPQSDSADAGTAPESAREAMRPGPDEDTARRHAFESGRQAREVSGEIVVDRETGVILKATLRGRFDVPADGGTAAGMDMNVSYELVPDKSLVVEEPKDVQAPRLRHAIDNPLWFLGKDAPAREDARDAADDDGDDGEREDPQPKPAR